MQWVSIALGALLTWIAQPASAEGPLWLVADDDDDDRNGVADNVQSEDIPEEDLLPLPESLLAGASRISVRGQHVRLVRSRTAVDPEQVDPAGGSLSLQGLVSGEATLLVEGRDQTSQSVPIRVARLRFLDGQNKPMRPARRDAAISLRVTNDQSLPSSTAFADTSTDLRNLRVELTAPTQGGVQQPLRLIAQDTSRPAVRDVVELEARRDSPRGPLRSTFIRLVADDIDREAPGARGRVLRVSLMDRVRARWKAPNGVQLSQDITVGMRGGAADLSSAFRAKLRVHIMRSHGGGPPVIGLSDASAITIAHDQVNFANRIWAQCGILLDDSAATDIQIEAPPPPALLSVADGDGLPSRGDGTIQFLADGLTIGPLTTTPYAAPLETAMNIARALAAADLRATVTVNPRTQFGAFPSADLLVRRPTGELVTLTPIGDLPVCSDSQQRLRIGIVDLRDGLQEFDNMTAQAGTLEERTLVKALADLDPTTIDVFIVNAFARGSRQGEAFIEASGSPLMNLVVVDRNGLSQLNNAWALAHEVGHVLLDEPLHPDNVGPDRPWLLMDADSSRGSVYGPKRLTDAECVRVLYESGPQAIPALLTPVP